MVAWGIPLLVLIHWSFNIAKFQRLGNNTCEGRSRKPFTEKLYIYQREHMVLQQKIEPRVIWKMKTEFGIFRIRLDVECGIYQTWVKKLVIFRIWLIIELGNFQIQQKIEYRVLLKGLKM
jgi:hypothetical protein